MNLFTKFYDTQAPEAQVGGAVDFAAAMAKGGAKTDGDSPAVMPVIIEDKQEQKQATTDAKPAETANLASNSTQDKAPEDALKAQGEGQQPPAAEITPPIAEAPKPAEVKVPTLQEVLSNQQPEAVLQALGYDEKEVSLLQTIKGNPTMKAFYENWVNGGDMGAYLTALNTNYQEMPALEVMRHQLRQEYPLAKEAQFNVLFEEEVLKRYGLDSDDEAVLERGRLLLEAKADNYRPKLIEQQQKQLIPKPPEPKATVNQPDPAVEQEKVRQQKEFEAYQQTVLSDNLVKDLYANKKITFEDGFTFPVNPDAIRDNIFSDAVLFSKTFTKGPDNTVKPDVEKQVLMSLVAEYGKPFFVEYAKHYKSLGGKASIEPIENAKPPENSTIVQSQPNAKNPQEAMAKSGQRVSGGY
jgi:hypothetical protein